MTHRDAIKNLVATTSASEVWPLRLWMWSDLALAAAACLKPTMATLWQAAAVNAYRASELLPRTEGQDPGESFRALAFAYAGTSLGLNRYEVELWVLMGQWTSSHRNEVGLRVMGCQAHGLFFFFVFTDWGLQAFSARINRSSVCISSVRQSSWIEEVRWPGAVSQCTTSRSEIRRVA